MKTFLRVVCAAVKTVGVLVAFAGAVYLLRAGLLAAASTGIGGWVIAVFVLVVAAAGGIGLLCLLAFACWESCK